MPPSGERTHAWRGRDRSRRSHPRSCSHQPPRQCSRRTPRRGRPLLLTRSWPGKTTVPCPNLLLTRASEGRGDRKPRTREKLLRKVGHASEFEQRSMTFVALRDPRVLLEHKRTAEDLKSRHVVNKQRYRIENRGGAGRGGAVSPQYRPFVGNKPRESLQINKFSMVHTMLATQGGASVQANTNSAVFQLKLSFLLKSYSCKLLKTKTRNFSQPHHLRQSSSLPRHSQAKSPLRRRGQSSSPHFPWAHRFLPPTGTPSAPPSSYPWTS